LQRLVAGFDAPIAIALNGPNSTIAADTPLNILVPTRGTKEARLAIEIALVLAKASAGNLTVLHVFDPREDTDLLRGRARRQGISFLVDARRLGKRSGVPVKGLTATNQRPEAEILQATREQSYDLIVLGASLHQGGEKFIGPHSAVLLRALRMPILLIAC
jgi:nucleotide-binding universal stress UspA family protein